ncbi:acyl dehydratase [Rhizobium mongolense]|uniref:Acyl dehydratase n=1 Tax=Rhizobium mongolense TaxID=57676 RepID=A0A7W6WC05_9HYPH|nr:acyl dehydratase [Rhizobium mongolense]
MKLVFEDFEPGRSFALGPVAVTAQEIIEFATEFDPQPMHLDEMAGRASILGGLAASGWHTSALFMRMMAYGFLLNSHSQGAPGIDVMEWRKPVLAGDTLSGRSTVLESRAMRSRPGIGIARFKHGSTISTAIWSATAKTGSCSACATHRRQTHEDGGALYDRRKGRDRRLYLYRGADHPFRHALRSAALPC